MKKKLKGIIFIFILIGILSASSLAASSVPSPVMKSAKSVVRVVAESISEWASGSGFIIGSKDGQTLIVTNYHVIEDSPSKIYIYDADGNEVKATLYASSKQKDFAVLLLEKSLDQKALWLNKAGANQGDAVYAVGFPSDADALSNTMAQTNKEVTITDGIVSSIHNLSAKGYGESVTILQINADINHGNSGGPLFDKDGEVVGINTYGVSSGINGAISAQDLIVFLKENNIPYNKVSPLLFILISLILAGAVFALLRFGKKGQKGKRIINPSNLIKKTCTLEDFVTQNGPLSINDAVSLLMPVITSIRDMHSNGNMHLEIAPKRIVVSSKGAYVSQPKKVEENRYNSGYAAPEIYSGKNITTASDIYSLCAVLYFATTGIVPENSLSRSNNGSLSFLSIETEKTFINTIKKGLSLDIGKRQSSVQEIIDSLIVFNTSSATINSSQISIPGQKHLVPIIKRFFKKNKPLSKKGKIIIWGVATLLLIVLLIFGPYLLTIASINSMDFYTAEKIHKVPSLMTSVYPELEQFINAGKLFNDELYYNAAKAFDNVGINFGIHDMLRESKYQYAKELEAEGYLDKAKGVYISLDDYKDSVERAIDLSIQRILSQIETKRYLHNPLNNAKELISKFKDQNIKGALYQIAQEKIEEENYLCAYVLLLSVGDFSDAKSILPDLKEIVYLEAIDSYRAGKDSKEVFEFLSGYKDANLYLKLSKVKNGEIILNFGNSSDYDIIGFEDGNEIALFTNFSASSFLKGKWRSTNGGYYFNMNDDGYISYNVPYINYGSTYSISDGTIWFNRKNEHRGKAAFKLSIIDRNTITIYSYQNNCTYTMIRQ